ncbi:aminodeoxychorismate synthase, component I [Natronosalvus halobius]|uniref:aminodeoxychorismate synthase, component I n=1 Tax=Natronosalvus halobius TaxID=2953746 RepID=UPI00209E0366|nr:aminodeoxychorismate synthase, component I [Natronosalvus halobius]USZ73007.1 aminodeoxychorismate synthase, component I [Natronosalvus halobius]
MNQPRVVTDEESFLEAARTARSDAGDGRSPVPGEASRIRLPVEVAVTVDDPFLAYRRARSESAPGAFLETTGGQSGWGYFGVDPVERLTVGPNAAVRRNRSAPGSERLDLPSITGGSITTPASQSPTLAALEGLLGGTSLVRGDCDVPYPCGVVGWLSYDVARELEDLPGSAVDDRGLPRLEVGVYDRLAAWECPVDPDEGVRLRVTACPSIDASTLQDGCSASDIEALEATYERARSLALTLARRALEGDPTVGPPPVDATEATFESTCGRDAFADRVRQVKRYVRDGDTFQANISQRLVAPAAVHPVAAYEALRAVNPAPYSCLLEGRSTDLVSASPELLLDRDDAFVRTEPIAGTRPRGEDPATDAALEADLRGDEKERAEHAMLVDLERNDLGKVCTYGSVQVEEYRRVDRYSEVMHLVSNVTGRLRPDATLSDAIAATFPGGTITGAPKPRTMAIIDELEATRRGPYTGGVGIFGFDGRATINIVIRTLVRYAEAYHLRVGAGIVHDSDPEREYDETLAKAQALLNAIDAALGERAAMTLEAGGEAGSGSGRGQQAGDGDRDDDGDGGDRDD